MDYQQTFWLLKGEVIDQGYFQGKQNPDDAFESAWVPLDTLQNFTFHEMHKRALTHFGVL